MSTVPYIATGVANDASVNLDISDENLLGASDNPLFSTTEEAMDVRAFARDYRALLDQRAADDPAPFDALAQQARDADVYLGCSCPTQKNPDVANCHTAHALRFMAERYPDLQVEHPG